MSRLRWRQLPIHTMVAWWVVWLGVALSPLNIFVPPTASVGLQFVGFIVCFLAGHAIALLFQQGSGRSAAAPAAAACTVPMRLHTSLHLANGLCLLLLLVSLKLSGALSDDFIEYFVKLRREELTGESLTGVRLLDVATKAIAWPLAFTVVVVALAARTRSLRWVLAGAALNILLFSYLWQVNYSLIYLFWFFVFYLLVGMARGLPVEKKVVAVAASLVVLLVAVAANRFGGDVLGGVQRYVFGYHTAGFSFYGHHFHDPSSLLHEHSFGRSSLGFLEQAVEIASRRLDVGFVAASSENATFNDEAVDIGAYEIIPGNAFGTFLFGFYRDFHFVGIAVGGLLYGGLATYLLNRSQRSWASGAAFYVLATAWMVGMMVNPIEQAHFWFALTTIGLLSILNRGVRL